MPSLALVFPSTVPSPLGNKEMGTHKVSTPNAADQSTSKQILSNLQICSMLETWFIGYLKIPIGIFFQAAFELEVVF
jgi:hypothetical protein